jgi:hypothetical protein
VFIGSDNKVMSIRILYLDGAKQFSEAL